MNIQNLIATGATEQALQELRRAMEIFPEMPAARLLLLQALLGTGDDDGVVAISSTRWASRAS